MKPGVLFVTPHSQDADLLSRMLSPLPLHLEHVADVAQARAKLNDGAYRVILTEAVLPDGTWLGVLSLARRLTPTPEVIVTRPLADARFGPKRSTSARTTLYHSLSRRPKCAAFFPMPVRGRWAARQWPLYNGFSHPRKNPCLPRLTRLSKTINLVFWKS